MEDIQIQIKRVRTSDTPVSLPLYMTHGASGMDLCADIPQDIRVGPMERSLIPTGIAIAIPEGFEGQVRPRSGLR